MWGYNSGVIDTGHISEYRIYVWHKEFAYFNLMLVVVGFFAGGRTQWKLLLLDAVLLVLILSNGPGIP